jgi:hypothetical protein
MILPDITLAESTWTNVFAAASLSVGTAVIVTTKTPGATVMLWDGVSAPGSTTSGYPVIYPQSAKVTAGSSGLWAYPGTRSVQIAVQTV